ncbi:hypothetical protein C7B61_05185 [filamentous cyanobacterium CCP1]|nr:hypothetical protein C7B76_12075 [filamentous cyanobacterium CCP2]PSB67627.1 hypothetical protein C7B61_05185 [filamentous cyanobacterium CCP1]
MNWSIFLTALSSASIEFLETAAIAYAIARSGYGREAIWGSITGLSLVAVAAIGLGAGLQSIPLHWLQLFIGMVLLWFGWGWITKSIRRQVQGKRAGWIDSDPLTAEGISLETSEAQHSFSRLNFLIMTKSAALEALEVALIVITLGLASGNWTEAIGATVLALLGSLGLVVLLHPYLVKLPEVLIKLGAGVLLCALGTFWLGEGAGLNWWFGDLAVLAIVAFYSLLVTLTIGFKQHQHQLQSQLLSSSTKTP